MFYKKVRVSKWVGIINLTPDSFSDGGVNFEPQQAIKNTISLIENGAEVIDVGAESTRPSATKISEEEEWQRLEEFLSKLIALKQTHSFKISIDSYKPAIIAKALAIGVDIVNDVSGLKNLEVIPILKKYNCDYVLMHSLTIPANKAVVLSEGVDVVEELYNFANQKIKLLEKNGISKKRIIFDVGIGFGKSAEQNIELIKNIEFFHKLNCRLMVGHSRKSFLNYFGNVDSIDKKDLATNIISEFLKGKVDYLRVHNFR
jgi:dihydropteroate synthase